jgi:hypothetical protein
MEHGRVGGRPKAAEIMSGSEYLESNYSQQPKYPSMAYISPIG